MSQHSPRSASPRRFLIAAGVIAVAGVAWWYWSGAAPATEEAPLPNPWAGPVPVKVFTTASAPLPLSLRAIGTVTPLASVTVKSRVEGELKRVLFEEGQMVKQGQLLAEIDPSLYRVRLAQAEGQQQQNLAQLKNAQDDLKLYQTLLAQDSIARQQLDRQQALVNQLQGSLKADQAQVDDAKLQLAWTRIEAPIAGRTGFRRVDPGNLIAANDSDGLVTITQTQPIAAVFTVPEHELIGIRREIAAGRTLRVEARDRDDRTVLAQGELRTLDNQIDVATGTVRLKAEFANGDDTLFPNQFVNIRLDVRTLEGAITIPTDAVQFGNKGTYVYVIGDDKRAQVRSLTLGPSNGTDVVVEDGLQAGERVVLEGLDRLREGREAVVVEDAPAAPAEATTPAPAGA